MTNSTHRRLMDHLRRIKRVTIGSKMIVNVHAPLSTKKSVGLLGRVGSGNVGVCCDFRGTLRGKHSLYGRLGGLKGSQVYRVRYASASKIALPCGAHLSVGTMGRALSGVK